MALVYRSVPERMAQVVPEARLVYVVRNPIARIRSGLDSGVQLQTSHLARPA